MSKKKTTAITTIRDLYDFEGAGDDGGENAPEPAAAKPSTLKHRPGTSSRNRNWDREHPPTCYRGIPKELHADIVAIAQELALPPGDIARKFLEYGLAAYRAGHIRLEPIIVGKRRLYVPEE